MPAATITENTAHTDDHRSDQDDEPKNNDHAALRTFTLWIDTYRPAQPGTGPGG
jgi:hypothetical protein